MVDGSTIERNRKQPLLIVISGPSGVGKDAVIEGLEKRELSFHFVVTVNTRPPRPGEVDGVDYIFVSEAEFHQMVARGELLEHAHVYNHYKGVPREHVRLALESGEDVILRLDVQGAGRIREVFPQAVLIFLVTPDADDLVERMEMRQADSNADMQIRRATLAEEMRRIEEFDYLVPNREGELEEAVETILAIIRAEHHRVSHKEVSL